MMKKLLIVLCFLLTGCVASQQEAMIQREILKSWLEGEWQLVSVNDQYPPMKMTASFKNNEFDITVNGRTFRDYAFGFATKAAEIIDTTIDEETKQRYMGMRAVYSLNQSLSGDLLSVDFTEPDSQESATVMCRIKFFDSKNIKLWGIKIEMSGTQVQGLEDFPDLYFHMRKI